MFGLVFVALVAWIATLNPTAASMLNRTLPNPNAYDELIRVAESCKSLPANPSDWSQPQLEELIATHSNALQLVRLNLVRPSMVPVDFKNGEAWVAKHHPQLNSLRRLARAIHAEGKLREMQGRTNEAVRVYLDLIQFAHQISRGGVVSDRLVTAAVEELGAQALQRILPALDAKTCRETAATLHAWDLAREPIADTIKLEHVFIRNAFGSQGRIIQLVQFRTYRRVKQTWFQNANRHQVKMQTLIVDLAKRAYTLERGSEPEKLEQLVPQYLPQLPTAPALQLAQ